MSKLMYTILVLVVILLGIIFAVLNAENVQLNYYFGSQELPLSLAMVMSMIVGAVLGVLASINLILRSRREISRLRKVSAMAEKEVANLRAIPIKNSH